MSLDNKVNILDVVNTTNKIETNLDNNFLPHGTIIKVELDGTGDFTSLVDAKNYLTGKYSNGIVTIQLGNGTFEYNETIEFGGDTNYFNFKKLIITGKGVSNTILSFKGTRYANLIVKDYNVFVQISNLTITEPDATISTYKNEDLAICCSYGSNVHVSNVTFNHVGIAVSSLYDSSVMLSGTLTINNACYAFFTYAGRITTYWGITVNASNIIGMLINILNGGEFKTVACNLTQSNVAKLCNITTVTNSSNGVASMSPN